jgi:tetratricopeptide (TPR) repeat protein
MVSLGDAPEEARLNEAVDLAQQAVELDPRDGMIRFIYGRALLAHRRYADAIAELNIAAELNPTLAPVYCGIGDALAYVGRFDEAIPFLERAVELSPHDPQRWAFYAYGALAHLFAQHFHEAADWAQKAIRVPNSHYSPVAYRAAALGHLPDERASREAAADLLRRVPDFTCGLARARLFFVKDPAHLDLYIDGLRRAGVPE